MPIDLTNYTENDIKGHFDKKCKLQYKNSPTLLGTAVPYIYSKPDSPMPRIISNGCNANIAAIKSYFTDRLILKNIANIIGTFYNTLIDGKYKMLILAAP